MNDLNIVFWNINRKNDIQRVVIDLIVEYDVDILVLVESRELNLEGIILDLLIQEKKNYYLIQENDLYSDSIKIISKFSNENFSFVHEAKRFSFRKLNSSDLYLCMVHMPSKLHTNIETQLYDMQNLKSAIIKTCPDIESSNIIVVGDFNANPFEPALINLNGLFALPTEHEVSLTYSRQDTTFIPFFNPMWQLLGLKNKSHGSYFYRPTGISLGISWHLFDQVILSKPLINRFDDNSLEIITKTKHYELLRNKKPNQSISDHLPLKFKILGGNTHE